MASCQEDQFPDGGEDNTDSTNESSINEVGQVPVAQEEASDVAPVAVAPPLAKAIEEEERKAAARYGGMKTKQSDVMRKRMMGGGKQYFDSGDYVLGKSRPNSHAIPLNISPEQPAPEKLRNRKASIPSKTLSRLT